MVCIVHKANGQLFVVFYFRVVENILHNIATYSVNVLAMVLYVSVLNV